MMQRKMTAINILTLTVAVIVMLAVPILIDSGTLSSICTMNNANAQDNPCLAQDATISAQEVQILQLQATNSAQEAQLLRLRGTATALGGNIVPRLITVEILITTTPVLGRVSTESSFQASTDGTLPPTVVNAQIEIVQVIKAGDITREGIEIRNNGPVVSLMGWTLSDTQGNVYIFPDRRLFTGGQLTVYTRFGDDTAIAHYWNRIDAVWGDAEDAVILTDSDGSVQSVYKLP
jgi:hypothetical protein